MSEDAKHNVWNFAPGRVNETKSEEELVSDEHIHAEVKASDAFDIVQIAPVERFNVLLKSGNKIRLACWVMLRHKTTGEVVITGAASPQSGGNGRLVLAIDMKDVDKFSPM